MSAPDRYPRIARPGVCWAMLQTVDHDGWILLDGRTIKRADYPKLFEALKVAGDTAVLPDARDRLIMGAGGKLKAGQVGGSSQLTLKPEHLPAHRHGVDKVTTATTPSQKALLTGVGLGDVTKPPTVTVTSGGAQTAEAGQGAAIDLPAPPHLALSLFVFAGR